MLVTSNILDKNGQKETESSDLRIWYQDEEDDSPKWYTLKEIEKKITDRIKKEALKFVLNVANGDEKTLEEIRKWNRG